MCHADDLIISHVNPMVVNDHIKMLDEEHGSKDPLSVSRGKIHEYLGMTIDFNEILGACIITQYDFIKKLHSGLADGLRGKSRGAPDPDFLFKVDKDLDKLNKKDKEHYHEVTAKCLWLSQRSRPDMQLATGFHCYRVKDPDVNDYNKLKHVMGCM